MKLNVAAWRRQRDGDDSVQVTEAVFTFVAIDAEHRPAPRHPRPPDAPLCAECHGPGTVERQ